MNRPVRPILSILVPIFSVFVGLLIFFSGALPIQTLRNAVFDQYQRWQPRVYTPQPVRIIDIDDESLTKIGQWPWPRTRIAELVQRLQDAGAASIGFDVVFAEPDRTSPKAMLNLWQLPRDSFAAIADLPDHDSVLANTLKRGRVVLGFVVERTGPNPELPKIPARYVQSGESSVGFLHEFGSVVNSLAILDTAASGDGALTFVPDGDGVVRRVPIVLGVKGEPVPTLVSESLRVGQDAKNYILKSAETGMSGFEEIRIGDFTIPTTAHGEIWVHYSEPVAERYIPAWRVLAGEVPNELLEGHLLLIGASAQGLMDLRSSPMGNVMPGVEAHAQALEQILGGEYLSRPWWAEMLEAGVLAVGGLIVGFLALYTRAAISSAVTLFVVAGAAAAAWYAFTERGLLFDPLTPALSILTTFVLASLIHHLLSEHQQKFVKDAFSRYVSPNLVNYLVSHPDDLELGGHRKECSFIFTDLAGFTSLMESIDPGDAVSLLNTYLDEMIAIAFRNEGTLDRIVGDAVAIMFSAPVTQPDHRKRALACALEMQAYAKKYADDLNAKGIKFGQTRIGIHTGEVIVGNFGGSTIFDYRALGDPVNTAARLESVNKHLGTRVCVSEATLLGCPEAVVRPVGRLVLKGKSQPLMVYEPLIGTTERDETYEIAFRLMRDERAEALPAFKELAARRPTDPLVKLHLGRLEGGETGDLIVMKEK